MGCKMQGQTCVSALAIQKLWADTCVRSYVLCDFPPFR